MNMMKLMKQAATLQTDIKRIQEDLAEQTVDFSSGGGMVKATAKGNMTIVNLEVDDSVYAEEDKEMVGDLILTAVNGALKKMKEVMDAELGKVTQGMGLPPGMGL